MLLPLVWKSFPFVYSADMALTLGLYWFKYWSPDAQEGVKARIIQAAEEKEREERERAEAEAAAAEAES